MPSPLLADAFAHHAWATIRVLDMCSTLDDAQLATTVPGTYGPIIDTLRHLVGGDVFYLDVLRGGEPEPFNEAGSDIPTLRSVSGSPRRSTTGPITAARSAPRSRPSASSRRRSRRGTSPMMTAACSANGPNPPNRPPERSQPG